MRWLSLTQFLLLSFSVTPKIHPQSEEFFIAHSELLKSQIKDINGNSSLLLDWAFLRWTSMVKLLVSTHIKTLTQASAPVVFQQQKLSWNAVLLWTCIAWEGWTCYYLTTIEKEQTSSGMDLKQKAINLIFGIFQILFLLDWDWNINMWVEESSNKTHSNIIPHREIASFTFEQAKYIKIQSKQAYPHSQNTYIPSTTTNSLRLSLHCNQRSPNLDIFFLTHRHHGISPWTRVSKPWAESFWIHGLHLWRDLENLA